MQSSVLLHTSTVRPTCFHNTQARSSGSARRGVQQICCAHGQNKRNATSLSLVAASCAAALLLQTSPADAKVIFEPVQSKKVFQGAAEQANQAASDAKDAVPSLPSAPSIGLPKVNLPKITPTVFSDSGDIDPRAVALPGALLAIGGGAFALSKIDPGFNEFMGSTSAKDSSAGNGAGYEQELLSNADGQVKGGKAAKKKVGSTINKKANEGGKQKKAGASKSGGIRGIFGGAAGSK